MSRSKQLANLLELVMDFANEKEPKTRYRLLGRINNAASDLGLMIYYDWQKTEGRSGKKSTDFGPSLFDPENDYSGDYQKSFVSRLDDYLRKGGFSFSHKGEFVCLTKKTASSDDHRLRMLLQADEYDNMFALFALLMLIHGYQSIKICPGCDGYFINKRKVEQKTCGNKCRQRVYQAKLSGKEKMKQKQRRSELYNQKKRGGK